jgi:hypothetical protein
MVWHNKKGQFAGAVHWWLTISDRPLSQRPEQSPKSTIEKAKTLIDSIHEFKRDSPMSKSIAIGMDKLDMRVHVIGGMVIFQRGSV